MKMMAADYIGAKIVPSALNPLGELVIETAPNCVAEFALCLRKIDSMFTHKMVSGGFEDVPMFTHVENYYQWFSIALGMQHPLETVQMFGEAEAEDFSNAFVDPEILEDYLTIAQGAARAVQIRSDLEIK
jgi:hypothetical protein